jgi:hypothetical protein
MHSYCSTKKKKKRRRRRRRRKRKKKRKTMTILTVREADQTDDPSRHHLQYHCHLWQVPC